MKNEPAYFSRVHFSIKISAETDFEQNYQNRFPHCSFFPYISGFFDLPVLRHKSETAKN
jgi:hypothetical protein